MSERGHGQESLPGNPGSGPGVITTDGCAVDFYALLPPGREPEIIHKAAGRAGACARIEDLALGRTFDVVLLASHLLNVPDTGIRQALLRTCAPHGAATGCVIIQHHPPQWYLTDDGSWFTAARRGGEN